MPLDEPANREPALPTVGAAALERRYAGSDARALVELAAETLFPGRIALASSFGAESAVLLHMVSTVARSLPVLFIDTGRMFPETLDYRIRLADRLGLTDVRVVRPDPVRVSALDPLKALWMTDPDLCCRVRKTEPLSQALAGFDAWFTGRKRFQTTARAAIPIFEEADGRMKVNPLARWSAADLEAYASAYRLPAHPLVARGYPSIGCVPCTDRVAVGEDARAGRWRGTPKTECGIHVGGEADGSSI